LLESNHSVDKNKGTAHQKWQQKSSEYPRYV